METEPPAVPAQPDSAAGPSIGARAQARMVNLMSGLIVTAPVGALVISVTTGAVFIFGWNGAGAVVGGLILGGLIWLVVGFLARGFLGVDRANRSIHRELTARMEAMNAFDMPPSAVAQLDALARELGVAPASATSAEERERLITQLQNRAR